MKLNEHDSMAWIHSHQTNKKKPMEVRNFYRIKGKIKSSTAKRKFELLKNGIWEQHIERIDQLETILKFSWENYHREQNPIRRQHILDSIAGIQPLLSAYYSASQEVIENDTEKGVQNTGHIPKLPN
tara:strand:+ start:129 stop:509 length:381 start_codon:yes stop_codon:yes gene_type:complete